MTRLESLRGLYDAVQAGAATDADFAAVWPATDEATWPIYSLAGEAYGNKMVDAALAFIAATLPGWWVQHLGHTRAGWVCRIERQGLSLPQGARFDPHSNPAKALLLAGLAALIAEEEAK